MWSFSKIKTLVIYQSWSGGKPFIQWIEALDIINKKRIWSRLNRLSFGNFGNCKMLSGNLFELRFVFGGGYRIYFCAIDDKIILLNGGDKATQEKDIMKAKQYLSDYSQRAT